MKTKQGNWKNEIAYFGPVMKFTKKSLKTHFE
jgi:hypothetical protein